MMTRCAMMLVLTLVITSSVHGQAADSVRVPPLAVDSTGASTPADTLTAVPKTTASFEERFKQFQKEKEKPAPRFSPHDSLVACFVSQRQNRSNQIERGLYHDAGDYFRSDPSFFVMDYLVTPMRKTVQPFGLSGDHLNLMIGGHQYRPFDHVLEPDGLTDLNDLPTTLDHDIYVLPGSVGQILGADQSVATLVTEPERPKDYSPRTAILHDRGWNGYNYTRGRYVNNFANCRAIDMSIEYRNTDGASYGMGDDSYNYFGDYYSPISSALALRVVGQLYNRTGTLAVGAPSGGTVVRRDRFDRNLRLSLERQNSEHTRNGELTYHHYRQGSNLGGEYQAWYNMTGHGVTVTHDWMAGGTIFQAEAGGEYSRYNNGYEEFDRFSGEASFGAARLSGGTRLAATAGAAWVEGYRFLPRAALVLFRETAKLFLTASVGYSERAPSLHELQMRFQRASIYGGADALDYGNRGNPNLASEKQLVGSFTLELGPRDNCVSLSATGGKIFDGIDWQNREEIGDLSTYTLFSPINGDVSFADVSAGARIRLKDFLHLAGGGAYHYLDYAEFADKPFAPEYQVFSGAELHVRWTQKLVDLFAYGEVAYVGPYHGYREEGLGQDLVINTKLTFGLKNFRFHYVCQNILNREYRSRDDMVTTFRWDYWGITWNFFD